MKPIKFGQDIQSYCAVSILFSTLPKISVDLAGIYPRSSSGPWTASFGSHLSGASGSSALCLPLRVHKATAAVFRVSFQLLFFFGAGCRWNAPCTVCLRGH